MRCTGVLSVFLAALPVMAVAGPLVPGCFVRDYTAAHLADHPEQKVASIAVWVSVSNDEETPDDAHMAVTMANTAAHALGQRLDGFFMCDAAYCGSEGPLTAICDLPVDADGFTVVAYTPGLADDPDVLDITTPSLTLFSNAECPEFADIADRAGQPTTFRMLRVDETVCQGLFQ